MKIKEKCRIIMISGACLEDRFFGLLRDSIITDLYSDTINHQSKLRVVFEWKKKINIIGSHEIDARMSELDQQAL